MWYVYILECRNSAYYTGATNDIARRVEEHKKGLGGKFTRGFGVRRLVYKEKCADRSAALKREAAIKNMTRAAKKEMVKDLLRIKR